jgi:hypothetical protein
MVIKYICAKWEAFSFCSFSTIHIYIYTNAHYLFIWQKQQINNHVQWKW